ncbi:MAG: DUF552 domain-containing protein [Candidatus Altiarchaeales archaeon]|nr:DUF552 domain-containing protein [Candidatus Altiarchaeales archaeon]
MVLDRILGGGGKEESRAPTEIDIEDYLNDLSIRDGKFLENEDVTYVKSLKLDSDGKGVGNVLAELEKNNLIVLNVRNLMGNKVLLKGVIHELRDACLEMDGDIGRISDQKLILVPAGMRILQKEQ